MSVTLSVLAGHLDTLLRVPATPDYPNAVNGVQFGHRGPIRGVASAVDASAIAITAASGVGANLLLVHHGLFWGGIGPVVGFRHERIRMLVEHDVAVYSAHLPLDAHEEFGNSRLLAAKLALRVAGGFARFQDIACGVWGEADIGTGAILRAADAFAAANGGRAVASAFEPDRRTHRWGICSGAGAGTGTIAEALSLGLDTLIVGEGPHWTAVDAPEQGLVIIYAGHYATETLGVQALGGYLSRMYSIPHTFVAAPTGL